MSSKDFTGPSQRTIRLNTTELDFEIRANEWILGSLVVEYDDGTSNVVTTSDDNERAIDRINLDTAAFTFGDVQRFPVYAKLGRMVLPFGTGT